MRARLIPLLFLISTCLSRGAIPHLSVTRTGALCFAASDLTTNGVPGLSNGLTRAVVSQLPAHSEHGGQVRVVNQQEWVRRYEHSTGWQQDAVTGFTIDSQDRVTLTGYSFPFISDDLLTIRIDHDGTVLWTNHYNASPDNNDWARRVLFDDAGGCFVIGESFGSNNVRDIFAIHYALDGTASWTNRYNRFGTNDHQLADAAVDRAGNLLLAFDTFYEAAGFYTTLRYDAAGTPLWTNYHGGTGDSSDYVSSMGVDASGNVFVTGSDYVTLKYSPSGVPLWMYRLQDGFGIASSLVVDHAGHAIVSGDAWTLAVFTNGGFIPPVRFYTTMKFADDGAVLSTNRIPTPDYQGGNAPQLRADMLDNLFVLGGSVGVTDSNVDFTITKLRPDGTPLWTNRFFESSPFRLATVSATAVDAAGNFYFTTDSTGPGGTNLDFLTVKYSPEGVLLWSNRFDGDGFLHDYPASLEVDSGGHVYVTGASGPEHAPHDLAVVKYVEYIHYTPPPDFVGTDSFTFVATDAAGTSVTNSVSVTVTAASLWFNLGRSDLRGANGTRRLHLDGASGSSPVILSASPDLEAWTPIATNAPVDGAVEFLFPAAGSRQFYRAVQNSGQ